MTDDTRAAAAGIPPNAQPDLHKITKAPEATEHAEAAAHAGIEPGTQAAPDAVAANLDIARGGDVADTLKALEALDAQTRNGEPPRADAHTESGRAHHDPATPVNEQATTSGKAQAPTSASASPAPVVTPADRVVPAADAARTAAHGSARTSAPTPETQAGGGAPPNALVVWEPPVAGDEPPPPPQREPRSMTRPFAIAAAIGVVALLGGIGANALIRGGNPAETGAASAPASAGTAPQTAAVSETSATIDSLAAEVKALGHRVAALDDDFRSTAAKSDVSALRDRVAALDDGVAGLRQTATDPKHAGKPAADSDQVARLNERIDRLEKQLAAANANTAAKPQPQAAAPLVNPSAPGKPKDVPRDVTAANQAAGSPDAAKAAAPKPPSRPTELAKAVPPPDARSGRDAQSLADMRPPADIPDPRTRPARGWVLRDLYDGMALIQGREGLIEVMPGQRISGLGRVEGIERRGRGWVVVTERGYIASLGY